MLYRQLPHVETLMTISEPANCRRISVNGLIVLRLAVSRRLNKGETSRVDKHGGERGTQTVELDGKVVSGKLPRIQYIDLQ
jgi:hypothetical protein